MRATDVDRRFTFTVELSDEEVMLIASSMSKLIRRLCLKNMHDDLISQACQDYPELEEYNPDAKKYYDLWEKFDKIYEDYIKI